MERYLMTKSLLESYRYVYDCMEGSEEAAKDDFLRVLNREHMEPNEAMFNGQVFESMVTNILHGKPDKDNPWYPGAKAVADMIPHAQLQVRCKRDLEVNGMHFLCYGILDALEAGVISDIKFKSKSFQSLELAGSYLENAQHPMYFYICPEAYEFRYLVSDGEDLYVERYTPKESPFIGDLVAEFIEGIDSMGLLPTYKEKWKAL